MVNRESKKCYRAVIIEKLGKREIVEERREWYKDPPTSIYFLSC